MYKLVVLHNGDLVRLPEDRFSNFSFNLKGFLLGFKFLSDTNQETEYRYFNISDFDKIYYQSRGLNVKRDDVPNGYYDVLKIQKFLAKKQPLLINGVNHSDIPLPKDLKSFPIQFTQYEWGKFWPKKDDVINIKSIYNNDHNFFMKFELSSFKVVNDALGKPRRYYKKSKGKFFDTIDFPVENINNNGFISHEIQADDCSSSTDELIIGMHHFFKKNFINRKNQWLTDPITLQEINYLVTSIAITTYWIQKDDFQLFIPTSNQINFWQNLKNIGHANTWTQNPEYDNVLNRLLYDLKSSWGAYTDFTYYSPFYNDFDVKQYFNYKVTVFGLSGAIFSQKDNLSGMSLEQKFALLIECASESILELTSTEFKITLIKEMFRKKWSFDRKSTLLKKIVMSITGPQINEFLEEMNKSNPEFNGRTIFELIYNSTGDESTNFLGIGDKSRKEIMYRLFSLWAVSDFNPAIGLNDYDDSGDISQPGFLEKIAFLSSHFESLPDPRGSLILDYSATKSWGFFRDNMDFKLSGQKIKVFKDNPRYNPHVANGETPQIFYGSFGIYQPVSLMDYNAKDTAIPIPLFNIGLDGQPTTTTAELPLFFLKYVDDYGDNLDNWTAGMMVADIALTFTGIGNIAKLRHLRHLGNFGKAWRAFRGGSTVAVTVYKVIKIGVGFVEFTASTVQLILQYTTNNCSNYTNIVYDNINDQTPYGVIPNFDNESDEYKACAYLDKILLYLQLASFASDVLVSAAIKDASRKIKNLPEYNAPNSSILPNGSPFQPVRDIINNLANHADEYAAFVQNIPNNVANQLSQLPELRRLNFMNEFATVTDPNFWNKMSNAGTVERWNILHEFKCPDRFNIDVLTNKNSRFSGYQKLYERPALRNKLDDLGEVSRKEFAQIAKNQDVHWFNKLESKPGAIDRWKSPPGQTKLVAKNDPELWLYVLDDFDMGTTYKKVGSGSVKHEFISLDQILHFRGERFGPPPRFNLEGLIKFKKLSASQQIDKLNEAKNTFNQGTVKYSTVKEYQDIPILISQNGMAPDFKGLGMAFDPPGSFNLPGMSNMTPAQIAEIQSELSEPLSSIINKIKAHPDGIKVPIIENTRTIDYQNMWRRMGIDPKDGQVIKEQFSLDIHHLDDLDIDLQTTLQIVTNKAHNLTKSHSGSVRLNEIFFDLINDL